MSERDFECEVADGLPTAMCRLAGRSDRGLIVYWCDENAVSLLRSWVLHGGPCRPGSNSVELALEGSESALVATNIAPQLIIGVACDPRTGDMLTLELANEPAAPAGLSLALYEKAIDLQSGLPSAKGRLTPADRLFQADVNGLDGMRSMQVAVTKAGRTVFVLTNRPNWSERIASDFIVGELADKRDDRLDSFRRLTAAEFFAEYPPEGWNFEYEVAAPVAPPK